MLTTQRIKQQIAYLSRIRAGLRFDYTIAYYAQDDAACHDIRAGVAMINGLIAQLRQELGEFETLAERQAAAVEEVERMLNLS